MMAPVRPPKITVKVTTRKSTMPAPTVWATAVPNVAAAMKLKNAAQVTALPGVSTRVDTTVAIELAASWKPLMKSNVRATAIRIRIARSVWSMPSAVLDDDAFEQVAHVLAAVGGGL